jgi:uncharacterized membrane protein YccC
MHRIAVAWRWARLRGRDLRPQLRAGLRVTVAAIVSFVLAQLLNIPLGGLWAVLTSVIVTQMSLGGSMRATIEYLVGTLGGAVYGGAIATLVPHPNEIALLAVLGLAVAPLAFLAAKNPSLRVAPFTAVIVLLGSSATHEGPVVSAVYRVIEVGLGCITALVVSLLVLPAHAYGLTVEAAADMLDLIGRALPDLFAGFTQACDAAAMHRAQDRIGSALARVTAIGAGLKRDPMARFAAQPDAGPLLRTLLRLRHDLVMIGRAAAEPLPEPVRTRLAPVLAQVAQTAADHLRASGSALVARRGPPPAGALDAAFDRHDADLAALRRERLTRDLSADAVERIFALGFALDQLRRNFADLDRVVGEFAQPGGVAA